jgi:hypothetical protein
MPEVSKLIADIIIESLRPTLNIERFDSGRMISRTIYSVAGYAVFSVLRLVEVVDLEVGTILDAANREGANNVGQI